MELLSDLNNLLAKSKGGETGEDEQERYCRIPNNNITRRKRNSTRGREYDG
jgi:hypothetical protein